MIDLSGLPSMLPETAVSERIRRRAHDALGGPSRSHHRNDRWLFAAAALYLVMAIRQAIEFLR